ncbi:MAG: hypothetical protein GY909_15145 [Oligoflexia bacterium]|nr:hypothetical protein [Oligoflexia bacterium]
MNAKECIYTFSSVIFLMLSAKWMAIDHTKKATHHFDCSNISKEYASREITRCALLSGNSHGESLSDCEERVKLRLCKRVKNYKEVKPWNGEKYE